MDTDRIERRVRIEAPVAKVWGAIADSREFGRWFKADIHGAFEPGAVVRGRILTPGYEHLKLEFAVERVEPERLLSFRWHPFAVDPAVDYSTEPATLVELRLDADGDATELTVVESGFDRLPPERRAVAFRMNSGGWDAQVENVKRYVTRP